MSFRPLLFSEYLVQRLNERLAAQPGWRAGAPLAPTLEPTAGIATPPGPALAAFFAARKQELSRFIDELSAEDFASHWLEGLSTLPLPEPLPDAEPVGEQEPLEAVREPPLRCLPAMAEEGVRDLYFMHRRLRLPAPAFALLQRCLVAEAFRVAEAVAWGEEADVEPAAARALIQSWLRCGLLRRPANRQ